ncbi:MAG TPA: AbrB/MazE/SpoVT family DNA-binding domain-containing protein [Thermoanaerobaculia bacterium]|nr:AbrB/MazE/SpoVT family DNA-binding domain-containing protein [Thermoanaerobaculia bacterium]
MQATIDKAGRVVIPREVREKAGFGPGTELEVVLEGYSVRLSRKAAGPRIEKRGKRLVARSTAKSESRPEVDLEALVREEREQS